MGYSRIKIPAPAAYHITSRIKNDDFLLENEEDKNSLLDIIRRASAFAGVTVISHSILDNHFHLLVHIPARREVDDAELERRVRILWGDEKAEERFGRWQYWGARGNAQRAEKERNDFRRRMYDISRFVKTIKEMFAYACHKRHGTCGSVWGASRFKSAAVSSDFKTLATVSAYIDLNAVRARIVRHPKSYKWCGAGAAKKGDKLALDGVEFLARDAERLTKDESALDVYMRFLDGTKARNKSVDRLSSKPDLARGVGGAGGESSASGRGGYVRRTLDSADLTRLGAEGVEQWLAASEIQPESASEMWTRRFGNFAMGGIIGPLAAVLTAREEIVRGAYIHTRWQPSMVEGVYSFIRERNAKARKRNAS
jgi:Transposase and inactivated derivatives